MLKSVANRHYYNMFWGESSIPSVVIVLLDHLGHNIQHQTVSSKVAGDVSKLPAHNLPSQETA